MIDAKTITRMAELSRLDIKPDEVAQYSQELSKALGYFQQIAGVDTNGIEPLVTPSEIQEFWREDEARQEFTADEMTANAPARLGNLFKVPPVV